ncbi:DegT/DnrJ/EryC1/StrS aminotransferase family protein [Magnetospirillum sp. 15-1]|uniref:DegT/DnrJ/EryC1/StrS family aminotransferase n=1 Tax=Magnetospirillum sp. 15-1 TaxID=1979370 RepID=UPI001482EAF5|nr:DegT/DnrJ/EryC1/StrS aminotransferase family protein [Magnetospirillum sp. 15-1]
MTDQPIPFGRPLLDQSEIDAVVKVLSGTQFVHGPVTKQFEEEFARRAGARHAISVSSCTAGLHLSLFVKGIKAGDKVAVPAMTHVATAHSVEYCGATPVFIDVQAETGNMDPDLLDLTAQDGLSAVTVVHYLGLPCDMDRINAIAARANAFVIEDCALAIDATYGDRKAGTLGLTGSFSFYPVKHMTTIEGGMITTNDDHMAELLRAQRAFGYDRGLGERAVPGMYDVTRLGYNYRMNEVEAAVGLTQLGKLDGFQAARARNYAALKAALADIAEITVFEPSHGPARSAHYCLNAILPKDGSVDRFEVVSRLNAQGIGTSVHYPQAVPLFSYYREKYGYRSGQFPVAEWLGAQTISLPVGPHVPEGYERRIAAAMKEAVRAARAP